MKSIAKIILAISFLPIGLAGCKKDWLDEKPQLSLVVPTTISDFQALLDGVDAGASFNIGYSAIDEISSDNYYVTDATWGDRSILEQRLYNWAPEIYDGDIALGDWENSYKRVFYANVVLEGIEKITPAGSLETRDWNNVKGAALFYRAVNHFDIAKNFTKQYDSATANSDLGIPLRFDPDINIPSTRASLKASYESIINDLKQAAALLPVDGPVSTIYMTRPNKAAAYGMLARVYLAARNYNDALVYADKSLQLYGTLVNYNSALIAPNGFFQRFNKETVFYNLMINYLIVMSPSRMIVDSTLYQLYDTSDLRRSLFFKSNGGQLRFYGSYSQQAVFFGGLATDELYLTRAECNARKGNLQPALDDLNTLLLNRWKNNGTFVPFTTTDPQVLLDKILLERRKELCFRGLRWMDLKRLNKEPRYADTLFRRVNGQTYQLLPNSPLYVMPIPPRVILLSGMQQNPR
jgi:starch-binding outer membrane protein, SusD/RagB family